MSESIRLFLRVTRPIALVLGLVSIMILNPAAASGLALADIPVPVNTVLHVVAHDMKHNDNRVSLARYTSSLSIDQSLDFYRTLWSDSGVDDRPGMLENRVGEWLLISRLQAGYNIVIQLKSTEPFHSTGFLSIMPLPDTQRSNSTSADFTTASTVADLQLLSSTQTQDGKRRSLLTVYSTSQSVDVITDQYLRHLTDQDWVLVSKQRHARNTIVLLNRNTQRIEFVASGDTTKRGSVLVVNEIHGRG